MNWFHPVIGQPTAVQLLTHALDRQRLAPAYLFVGPEGVGRALTARCFLQAILKEDSDLSNHPDVLWLEPTYSAQGTLYTRRQLLAADKEIPRSPPQIRLEQIRQLSRHLSQPPMRAPRSLVVLTQAETMNEAAANALLKTLEEPGRATLILIAPSPSALLNTIVSRCQKIPFYPLNRSDLEQVLRRVAPPEFWQEVSPALFDLGAGSPGAVLQAWQTWREIPEAFRHLGKQLTTPLPLQTALELARDISQSLDVERQFWLLGLMQQQIWQGGEFPRCVALLQQLERARQYLQQYVQPRLVWEVLLMQLGTV
ncbi:DNA polymerase III subunit delta' [Thermosynechococcus sp. HN-54]|uniref:DNA polymerase III subunit delta' n=1 Tax=Thermosynechococcus sp. HN-54 TaxID=2933959 RepID=UPI00202CD642|nr:DNA polymerase III subunit delta' [Thermosynechococcus sp. HN-54]URR34878.1 DNA polymerase III subunit delta' [Thermosynechococcus sp. HN-54]